MCMQPFTAWFKSLNGRVIFYSVMAGLLPMLLLGSSTTFISAYFVRQQATQLVSDIIHDRVQGVINLQSPVDLVSRHIVSDTRLLKILKAANQDSAISELRVNELVGDSLSQYFTLDGLSAISLILENQRFYSLSTEVEYVEPDFDAIQLQLASCDFSEQELCWPGVESNINSNSKHELIIPAIRRITLLNETTMVEEPIGFLYLGFSVSSLHRILMATAISEDMAMIVVDRERHIIFHPDPNQIGTQVNPLYLPDSDGVAQQADVNGLPSVLISLTAPNTGWRFVVSVPKHKLYQGVYQIIGLASGLLLLTLIILVFVWFNVRDRILIPLNVLTAAMKDKQKSVAGYDSDKSQLREIQTLFYWYNNYVAVVEQKDKQAEELRSAYEQLQLTQEQLIESEKMAALGKLVAGVAHEINTPIGVSITSLSYAIELHQQLAERFASNQMKRSDLQNFLEKSQQGLEISANNLNRATRLVETFKTVATEQHIEEVQRFSMAGYLSSTIISLEPKARRKNVTILWSCAPDIELVSYQGVLWQLLSNLVINSLTHAFDDRETGSISLEVVDLAQDIELVYRDDGCGMDEDTCSQIFLPFFTTKRNAGGTGLGMHIAYNLVTQKLAGCIRCTSTLGEGVEFRIRFPKQTPH